MNNNYKVLGVIPARSGSKGVADKNIKPLAGKPLLAWTAEAAHNCNLIDELIISTDSEQYIEIARNYGCKAPFVRPDHLATDEATSQDMLLHALGEVEDFDIAVVLQPTSPFRSANDIRNSLRKFDNRNCSACISVKEVEDHPDFMFVLSENDRLESMSFSDERPNRRQDLQSLYIPNGALYVLGIDKFMEHRAFFPEDSVGYVMPPERSFDIDTKFDFELAEIWAEYKF